MNIKTLVLVLVLLAMVAYGGYYLGNRPNTLPQPANLPTPTGTIPTTPAPTVDEAALLRTAIKQGLIAEHGSNANNMNVTVSKIQGNYAQGGAVDPASVGGAMWLAVKENGVWKLVWDGNGTISCALTTQYPQFPVAMVPECWNETTSKSVKR